jgi:hypothetical protein
MAAQLVASRVALISTRSVAFVASVCKGNFRNTKFGLGNEQNSLFMFLTLHNIGASTKFTQKYSVCYLRLPVSSTHNYIYIYGLEISCFIRLLCQFGEASHISLMISAVQTETVNRWIILWTQPENDPRSVSLAASLCVSGHGRGYC